MYLSPSKLFKFSADVRKPKFAVIIHILLSCFRSENHYCDVIIHLIPYRKRLFADRVSANKKLFADTVSANKKLFADSGVPIEKKHVKGGGLLYGGLL